MRSLHITNGDSAGQVLQRLFPQDVVLAWRDALHDGPSPAGLTFEEFSEVRAQFLAECGWTSLERARAEMHSRNSLLAQHGDFDETVLWFEHDLYDQLQLLQILDWFSAREARLVLIQSGTHLGGMDDRSLAALYPLRRPVQREQFETAREAWRAFCSADPHELEPFLLPNPAMPFLAAALLRYCEEYPWVEDGLTRTERVIVSLRGRGISDPHELFREYSSTEESVWMGDSSFFRILAGARDHAGSWLWNSTLRRFERRPS